MSVNTKLSGFAASLEEAWGRRKPGTSPKHVEPHAGGYKHTDAFDADQAHKMLTSHGYQRVEGNQDNHPPGAARTTEYRKPGKRKPVTVDHYEGGHVKSISGVGVKDMFERHTGSKEFHTHAIAHHRASLKKALKRYTGAGKPQEGEKTVHPRDAHYNAQHSAGSISFHARELEHHHEQMKRKS